MPKQDPSVKGNPWLLEWDDETACWLVPSASADRRYSVSLRAAEAGELADACGCLATMNGRRCWHIETAELREQLDDCAEKCARYYADWSLRELQAEDLRLLLIGAHEGMGPFLRTQHDAVGDAIAARLDATTTAA